MTTPHVKRDPRVDPKPGDVLRGEKSDRYVGKLYSDGLIGFTYWQRASSGSGNDCYCSLKAWLKWANNAEVIHCAD